MTRRALDPMPPKPRHIGLPAQRGADAAHDPSGRPPLVIPEGCGECRWLLAGTDPATWRLVEVDSACKLHGDSSDEKDGAGT